MIKTRWKVTIQQWIRRMRCFCFWRGCSHLQTRMPLLAAGWMIWSEPCWVVYVFLVSPGQYAPYIPIYFLCIEQLLQNGRIKGLFLRHLLQYHLKILIKTSKNRNWWDFFLKTRQWTTWKIERNYELIMMLSQLEIQ